MAINLFAGQQMIKIARETFQATSVYNEANLEIAYWFNQTDGSVLTFQPGRAFQQFNQFVAEEPYSIRTLVNMDQSNLFIPPIPAPPPTTIAGSTSTSTTATTTAGPTTTQDPNGIFRHANNLDAVLIDNANVGDYLLSGANASGGRDIDVRPSFGNTFTLNSSLTERKILIKGGDYDSIYLELPGLSGTDERPIIITNYGGQIKCKRFTIKGISKYHATFKYDPQAKTGDPNFRGHLDHNGNKNYAYTSGKYGLWVDNQWGDLNAFLITASGSGVYESSDYEWDFFESGNGGFSNVFKSDVGPSTIYNQRIHDFYIHDTFSEGLYMNSTGADPTPQSVNLHIWDGRCLRCGNDGIQIGQIREGCVIENMVVHGAINWKSPFGQYQDNAVQLQIRNGGVIMRNNVFIGAGEKFINFFTSSLSSIVDNNQLVDINNNLFLHCRGPVGGFFGPTSYVNAPIRIKDNFFGKFIFGYNEVYTGSRGTASTAVLRFYTNNPLTLSGNRWDGTGGKTSFYELGNGATPSVNATDNQLVPSMEDVSFQDYMGFPDGFNYLLLEHWAKTIGTTYGTGSEFEASGSKKGDPIYYAVGDYVMYKSKLYKSLQAQNYGNEPGVTAGWSAWWELITFANGSTTPPDDVRLKYGTLYNSLDMGLSDNLTYSLPTTAQPTTTSLPPTTLNPVMVPFLYMTAEDNGDNTFTLGFDRNRDQLLLAGSIVGIGSSTLAGTGSSSQANSIEGQISSWLSLNTFGTLFVNMAKSGFDTRYTLPDGGHSLVDKHRNLTSALSMKPTAIYILLPSNDIGAGYTASQFLAGIVAMYNAANLAGVPCFIGGVQPRTAYSSTQQQSLAEANQLLKTAIPASFYIDNFDQLRDGSAATPAVINPLYDSGDGVHLNDAGQALVASAAITKINAYFQNQAHYGYVIQRSTSPTSGWQVFDTTSVPSIVRKTYNRTDFQKYYYRFAIDLDGGTTYSAYSSVVSLEQPLQVGNLSQTLQLDFSVDTSVLPPVGWNHLGAPTSGAVTGAAFSSLADSSNGNTGISLAVTKGFGGAGSGGATSWPPYPLRSTEDNWYVLNTQTDVSEIELSGMTPNVVYNARILSSRTSNTLNRFIGCMSQGRRDGARSSISASQPNNSKIIYLKGLIADSGGKIKFEFRAPGGVGYLNALILERYTNDVPLPTTTSIFTTSTTATTLATSTTTVAPGGNLVQVNIYGGANGYANSGWNNWDIGGVVGASEATNDTSQLLNLASGVASSIYAIMSTSQGVADNGSAYGGTIMPAEVIRYGSYSSSNRLLTIKGLDNSKTYDLEFIGSRANTGNTTEYVIGGVSQTLVTDSNKTSSVIFTAIAPVNGDIVVSVKKLAGSSYNYLNAFKIGFSGVAAATTSTTTATTQTTTTTTLAPTTTFEGQTTAPPAPPPGGPAGEMFDTHVTSSQTGVLSPGNVFYDMTAKVYLPDDYNTTPGNHKYPTIFFIPGLGESGTDSSLLLVNGPLKFINQGWNGTATWGGVTHKFIIIGLLPRSDNLYPSEEEIGHKINECVSRWKIDTDRMHGTGFSRGGGVWHELICKTGPLQAKLASVVAMAAQYLNNAYSLSAGFASEGGQWWGFEGTFDNRNMSAIRDFMNLAVAGSAKYTLYAGVHADAPAFYNPAYTEAITQAPFSGLAGNIYQWMAVKSIGVPVPLEPGPTTTAAATTTSTSTTSTTSTTTGTTQTTATTTAAPTTTSGVVEAKFNFSREAAAVAGWNNMTGSPHSSVIVATDSGSSISLSSVATANWSSYAGTYSGFNGGGVNAAGFFPAAVMVNEWYQYGAEGQGNYDVAKVQLRLSSLDTAATYTIRMSASDGGGFDSNPTLYRVKGASDEGTQSLNPIANTDNGVTFNNVAPNGSGQIDIYVNTQSGSSVLASICGLIITKN